MWVTSFNAKEMYFFLFLRYPRKFCLRFKYPSVLTGCKTISATLVKAGRYLVTQFASSKKKLHLISVSIRSCDFWVVLVDWPPPPPDPRIPPHLISIIGGAWRHWWANIRDTSHLEKLIKTQPDFNRVLQQRKSALINFFRSQPCNLVISGFCPALFRQEFGILLRSHNYHFLLEVFFRLFTFL